MRIPALLLLSVLALGCRDRPRKQAPKPRPTLIYAEPLPSLVPAESFDGCHGEMTPMLTILSKTAYLDGTPVDVTILGQVLRQRRDLYEQMGAAPPDHIVVQVDAGVSEKRVWPFLASARGAGFVNVTRMGPAR